jgi:hypothetical protein
MTAKNQKTCPEAKPDYEPTKRERAVVSRFLNEQAEWAPRVKISGPEDPGLVTRLKFANLRQNATIEDLNTGALTAAVIEHANTVVIDRDRHSRTRADRRN